MNSCLSAPRASVNTSLSFVYVDKINATDENLPSDEEITYFKVLLACMEHKVLSEFNATHVIVVYHYRAWHFDSEIEQKSL